MGMTTAQATRLDKSNPEFQRATPFARVQSQEAYGLVVLTKAITADATGEVAVDIPFAVEVIDVIVQARATVGGGTMTLKKGATAITNAIVCAVDTTITRAGTIDDAQSTLAAGDTVTIDAANAGDRALVSILCRRL